MGRTGESSVRNLLFGAAGAVVGVYAMDAYFQVVKRLARKTARRRRAKAGATELVATKRSRHSLDDISLTGIRKRDREPATATLGRFGYRVVTGEDPDKKVTKRLSTGIHWGYGIAAGALYGLLRGDERAGLDLPVGIGYGAMLWLLGDEVIVPLLGLSAGPTAYPVTEHARALGGHLMFGAATSAATQALHHVA